MHTNEMRQKILIILVIKRTDKQLSHQVESPNYNQLKINTFTLMQLHILNHPNIFNTQ